VTINFSFIPSHHWEGENFTTGLLPDNERLETDEEDLAMETADAAATVEEKAVARMKRLATSNKSILLKVVGQKTLLLASFKPRVPLQREGHLVLKE
jgi:hypothetical protein